MRLTSILMAAVAAVAAMASLPEPADAQDKELVYLTPGLDLPFWRYLSREGQRRTTLIKQPGRERLMRRLKDRV